METREVIIPKNADVPSKRSGQTKNQRKSRDVKDKVRLVVGDLENVATELKAIVLELKLLVRQIDTVTEKLDLRFGPYWRESEIYSVDETNDSAEQREKTDTSKDTVAPCMCNRIQLHRVLYMPKAVESSTNNNDTYISGYNLETNMVGNKFKSKLLPCLDYNQNESFDTEYIETQTSISGGSEFLPPTFTSEEDLMLPKLKDKSQKEVCPFSDDIYSGFYEADVDDKLENYINFVDTFESSEDENDNLEPDPESFRIISSLPDATDSRTRYDMVATWAQSAMLNLANENFSSEDSAFTISEDTSKTPFLVSHHRIPQCTLSDTGMRSELMLFQNEVQSDVGLYRSVLVC